jgi:hypothetical protein
MAIKKFMFVVDNYDSMIVNWKQDMVDFVRESYPEAYCQGSSGTWTFLSRGRGGISIVGEGIMIEVGTWEIRVLIDGGKYEREIFEETRRGT